MFGVCALAVRDQLGKAFSQGLLAPRRTGAQHIEAHACDNRRQPSPEILDSAGVRPAEF
jgi:hypothetical protein